MFRPPGPGQTVRMSDLEEGLELDEHGIGEADDEPLSEDVVNPEYERDDVGGA